MNLQLKLPGKISLLGGFTSCFQLSYHIFLRKLTQGDTWDTKGQGVGPNEFLTVLQVG